MIETVNTIVNGNIVKGFIIRMNVALMYISGYAFLYESFNFFLYCKSFRRGLRF